MAVRRRLLILAALVPASMAQAHSGWGIVEDSRGNIYYTDLAEVWKVSPDGAKRIVVPGVHTHELFIDASDNLYGEHLWYEGERTNKWGYRVWRRSPDGRIANVVPPTTGFRTSYSFIRDVSGNHYWQHDGVVHRMTAEGVDMVVARHRFHDIRSMAVSPEGELFLVDEGNLYRLRNGKVDRLAAGINEHSVTMPFVEPRHRVMGLWPDRQHNVYAAVFGAREVKRISPGGRVDVISRSPIPWSPSGGMIARDGSLWLLESTPLGQVWIRNASRRDRSQTLEIVSSVAAILIIAALFVARRRGKARTKGCT